MVAHPSSRNHEPHSMVYNTFTHEHIFLRHGRKKVHNNVSQQYINSIILSILVLSMFESLFKVLQSEVIYNVWVYPFPFIIFVLFSLNSLASIQTNTKLL